MFIKLHYLVGGEYTRLSVASTVVYRYMYVLAEKSKTETIAE